MNNLNLKIYWSDEDESYICECDEYPTVGGVGETKKEAEKIFYELLEGHKIAEKEGRLLKNKGGRPKKNNVRLSYNVPADVKAFIELEALKEGLNQGALIERMVSFYKSSLKEA